ncbi:MAG: hypothetical protein LBB26_04365 [Puniceicoccales bacterium]|jgi:hypothetical protein|nr:hypothetical protein [Puniceicoccales bacterium]
MISSVSQEYPYLAAVVRKAAASSDKSPLAAVATAPVNVYNVIKKLSWFGFFTHLKILVEVGVYRNSVCAFFIEIFSWYGSRRVDVYARILGHAGFQVDTTPPAGVKISKPAGKQPPRIVDLLVRIDQKMSAPQKDSPETPVPGPPQSLEEPPTDASPSPEKPPAKGPPPEEELQAGDPPVKALSADKPSSEIAESEPPLDAGNEPKTDQPQLSNPVVSSQVQEVAFVSPFAIERATPVGIPNVGSNCYVASMLQLMFQNRQLCDAVAELCTKVPRESNYQKLLHSLNDILLHLQNGEGPCPKALIQNFLQIGKDIGYIKADGQDDSTVLRMSVLSALEELFTGEQPPEILALKDKLLCTFYESRSVESLEPDGRPGRVYANISQEVKNEIIVSPNMGSLEAGLEQHYGFEELIGDNRYEYEGGYVDARVGTEIWGQPPATLTVKIGRVSSNTRGVQKNTARCTFPEIIDLGKFMTSPKEESRRYRLNAVIAHGGSSAGGHYISFVKRGDQWFRCDDGSVSRASWSDIKKLFGGKPGGFDATFLSYAR